MTELSTMRSRRKTRTGVVTSDKMEKTVTVSLVRRYAHPVYGKQVTRTGEKGRRREGGDRADGQRDPSQGRLLHPIRRERRGAHQRRGRAASNPHLRPCRPRAAREALHEDRLARAGGAVA